MQDIYNKKFKFYEIKPVVSNSLKQDKLTFQVYSLCI